MANGEKSDEISIWIGNLTTLTFPNWKQYHGTIYRLWLLLDCNFYWTWHTWILSFSLYRSSSRLIKKKEQMEMRALNFISAGFMLQWFQCMYIEISVGLLYPVSQCAWYNFNPIWFFWWLLTTMNQITAFFHSIQIKTIEHFAPIH